MTITSRRFLISSVIAALICGVAAAAAQNVEPGLQPPPKAEVIPQAPGPGYNWVPGHWTWRKEWVWIPGHHIHGPVPAVPADVVEVIPARPGPRYYWIKGHHTWEDDRWVWHKGFWVH